MQKDQHFSYDLTQRLTYYVISAELIFCGYVLLNSDKFGVIKYSSILFLLAGIAAFSGVLWRFGYNQNQHDIAHVTTSKNNRYILGAQLTAYWVYIVVSVVFYISLLGIGYSHIKGIESAENGADVTLTVPKAEKVAEPKVEKSAPQESVTAPKQQEESSVFQSEGPPETKPNNSSKRDTVTGALS